MNAVTATQTISNRLALGTMALVGFYDSGADTREARSVLSLACESGISLFHTAGHYGNGAAFELLRTGLTSRERHATQVCVKIEGHLDRLEDGPEGICTSLRGLGRETIDFAQIVESQDDVHARVTIQDVYRGIVPGAPLRVALEAARSAGKIKNIGVEAYTREHVAAAIRCRMDFVVCDQSLIRQVIPPASPPDDIRSGVVKFIAIRPLAGGWLTPQYARLSDFKEADHRRRWYTAGEGARSQVEKICDRHGIDIFAAAMRFLLERPYPHWIALGIRTLHQLKRALDPMLLLPLPEEVEKELALLFVQPFVLEE